MINTLSKLEIEKIFHNFIEGPYKKIVDIIFDGKIMNTFSSRVRPRQEPLSPSPLNIRWNSRLEKEKFTDSMIVYVENLEQFIYLKKLLELISKVSKASGCSYI